MTAMMLVLVIMVFTMITMVTMIATIMMIAIIFFMLDRTAVDNTLIPNLLVTKENRLIPMIGL